MKIGTRGSDLAITQTDGVARILTDILSVNFETVVIKTKGDIITDRPLRELEGMGYFTKEIEDALLDRRIDLAVHSFKDMPSESPDDLIIAALSEREDPADLLIINKNSYDNDNLDIPVKTQAIAGTSAVRRQAQVHAIRDDLNIKDLRGNVPTRIQKLADGEYDAIFLAYAGIRRLGIDLSEFEVVRLDPTKFIPSPGQGILAIQMRAGDKNIDAIRQAINDKNSEIAARIERKVLANFGGGCGLPLGAYAYKVGDKWFAYGFWGGNSEKPIWANASSDNPENVGKKLSNLLSGET